MTDDELQAKFFAAGGPLMGSRGVAELSRSRWDVVQLADLTRVARLLRHLGVDDG